MMNMFQMCSMVDVFKFVVELGLGQQYNGTAPNNWMSNTKYCDQYYNGNQSILSFIQGYIANPNVPVGETRYFADTTVSPTVYYPFILTTTDELFLDTVPWTGNSYPKCALRNHVMCMRTKSDANYTDFYNVFSGAKLAIYSKWVLYPPSSFHEPPTNPTATTYNWLAPIVDGVLSDDGGVLSQDYEYYDYLNYNNRAEVSIPATINGVSMQSGSDYPLAMNSIDRTGTGFSAGNGAAANHLLNLMKTQLGNLQMMTSAGPPALVQTASGFVASMLTRTLVGYLPSPVSTYLYTLTASGIYSWYTWLHVALPSSTCSE
jgi:hypothetical protein